MSRAEPKVSVLMITYNHEPFIAHAIESVLAQKTNFPIELVIGEDCSTDRTRTIALNYQHRFPDKIRLLPTERNLGMQRNFLKTYAACNGEYIAILEGDDYWTAPDKLQIQVNFLDAHPEYSLCFHQAVMVDEVNLQQIGLRPGLALPDTLMLHDVLINNYIPTNAVVLRRKAVPALPMWLIQLKLLDWPLWVLYAQQGKLRYMEEQMSVYRIHRGGVWSGTDSSSRVLYTIAMQKHFNMELVHPYKRQVDASIVARYCRVSRDYLGLGERKLAVLAVLNSLPYARINVDYLKLYVKMMLLIVFSRRKVAP